MKSKKTSMKRLKGLEVRNQPTIEQKRFEVPTATNLHVKTIDAYVKLSTELEKMESKLDQAGDVIIDAAQTWLSSQQEFYKSCRFEGLKSSVRVVSSDKFSIVNQDGLKKAYPSLVVENKVVSIRKDVMDDKSKLDKLLKKFTDEELKEYFDISVKIQLKKGLDEELTKSLNRDEILTLVKQARPGIVIE